MEAQEPLDKIVDDLYVVFARYGDSGGDFCSYCYSELDMRRIKTTTLRELSADDARTLLWESPDHWESQDVYRHYLPRMLEVMGPPLWVEDLYGEHLFDTARALGFANWSPAERTVVTDYLRKLEPLMTFPSPGDREVFINQIEGLEKLSNTPL